MTAAPIRVLIVDDHAVVAEAVEHVLRQAGDFEVVGSATSFAEALEMARTREPDVLVLDFQLPGEDAPVAIGRFLAEHARSRVLVLTGRSDEQALSAAIQAGCAGYVLKGEPLGHLVDAIRQVYAGGSVLPPGLALEAVRAMRERTAQAGADLTARETEVLRHLAGGLSLREIADTLSIRLNTVRNHVQSVLVKLNAHSQREAVVVAIREGIVDVP